ncbi:MAG: sigma-70 family RNA polymerase sigma factor [Bryobacterales bacterium]|nr:sigma-70 family RNA polymerase sigma factor [Bryobacterales bacterium]
MLASPRAIEERMNDASRPTLDTSSDWQGQFIQDNLRRIFLQVYRLVGSVEDAQDLTQEVFIKALQRKDQIKEPGKAAHWLSRIATNTAIDFLRKAGRAPLTELDDVPEPVKVSREESPEDRVLRAEQREHLEGGLRLLSDRERMALVLRDVEGLSADEVAEQLRCSKATVRSHIANARLKFKKYLERRRG